MPKKRKSSPKGSTEKVGKKKVLRASSRAVKPVSFLHPTVELVDSDDSLGVGESSGGEEEDAENGAAPSFAYGINQPNPGGEFKMSPLVKLGDKVWKILKDKYFWKYRRNSVLEYSYDYIAVGFDINTATEGVTKFAGCEALGRQARADGEEDGRKIAKRAIDALNSSKEAHVAERNPQELGEDSDLDSSIEFLSTSKSNRRRVPREVSLTRSVTHDDEEEYQRPAAVQSTPAIKTDDQERNGNDAPPEGFDEDTDANFENDDPNPAELTLRGWLKDRVAKLSRKEAKKYASKFVEHGFEAAEVRDVCLYPQLLTGKLEMKLGHAIFLARALKAENHPGFLDFDMRELS